MGRPNQVAFQKRKGISTKSNARMRIAKAQRPPKDFCGCASGFICWLCAAGNRRRERAGGDQWIRHGSDYFVVGVDGTGCDVFCAGAAPGAGAAGLVAGPGDAGAAGVAALAAAGGLTDAAALPSAFLKTGISPACHNITTSIRPNMPPIIRQMNSSMMPSMPLVSRPLLISQTIPQIERSINSAQRPLSSIQLDLG